MKSPVKVFSTVFRKSDNYSFCSHKHNILEVEGKLKRLWMIWLEFHAYLYEWLGASTQASKLSEANCKSANKTCAANSTISHEQKTLAMLLDFFVVKQRVIKSVLTFYHENFQTYTKVSW